MDEVRTGSPCRYGLRVTGINTYRFVDQTLMRPVFRPWLKTSLLDCCTGHTVTTPSFRALKVAVDCKPTGATGVDMQTCGGINAPVLASGRPQ